MISIIKANKKILLTTAVLTLMLSLSGCNTAKGFGEDLEKLGDKISTTADKAAN